MAGRLLLLLMASLALAGCQESLPAWEMPDTPLEGEIIVEANYLAADLSRLSPDFAVTVTNTSDEIDSWVLPVPYDVEVNLTIFMTRDPSRNVPVTINRRYTNPIDDLVWGYYVVLGFDIPLRDSGHQAWNAGPGEVTAVELTIQGRVRINQLDLEVNLPRKTTIIGY